MKSLTFLTFTLALLLSRRAATQEPPSAPASLVVHPTTVMVDYRRTVAEASVRVEFTEDTLPIVVRLHALRLGEGSARALFIPEERDWIELGRERTGEPKPSGIAEASTPKEGAPKEGAPNARNVRHLAMRFTGLELVGRYEGTVDAVATATGTTVASAKILIERAGSRFAPTIVSDHLKDDRLKLVGEPGDQFMFQISNPTAAPERLFAFTLQPSGKGLTLHPDRVRLKGGQSEPVVLTLGEGGSPGSPHRVLRITAKDDPDLVKSVMLELTDASRARRLLVWPLLLVLAGAILSLVINNVFPTTVRKARNRGRLSQIEALIRGCSRVSAALQAALLAEAARVRLLNGMLSWTNPSKDEDMQLIDGAIVTLLDRITRLESVSALRLQVEQANLIPVTARYEVEVLLRHAEDAISDGQIDAARAHVQSAVKLKDDSGAAPAMAELKAKLLEGIDDLAARPAPANRPHRVAVLLAELQAAKGRVPDMPASSLLETERDYNAVYTYIESGESALARRPGDEGVQRTVEMLFDLLSANPLGPQVVSLVDMIDSDLSLEEVTESLGRREGRIVCNANPRLYELGDYRFELTDPRIASVPGAARLASFQWDFKDGTSSADFSHSKHFYVEQVGGRHFFNRKWPHRLDITVAVTAPLSTKVETFSQTLSVQKARDGGHSVMIMQGIRFLVTTLISVFAAFGTQYAVAPEQITFATAITAFLFGFSLDQVRSKTSPTQ